MSAWSEILPPKRLSCSTKQCVRESKLRRIVLHCHFMQSKSCTNRS